ncbi:MAG: hypothetical protein AAF748_15225 [Pseudomonadota bacterium]
MADLRFEGDVEPWLRKLPHDKRTAFVLRNALRILPNIFHFHRDEPEDMGAAVFLLAHLRVAITGCAVIDSNENHQLLRQSLRSAIRNTQNSASSMFGNQVTASLKTACEDILGEDDDASIAFEAYVSAQDAVISDPRKNADFISARDRDAELLEEDKAEFCFESALWANGSTNSFLDNWVSFHEGAQPSPWGFWIEWYEGLVTGKHLHHDLNQRVARIKDPIWEAGCDAVAEEIDKERVVFGVQRIIEDLKRDFVALRQQNRHGIGGNNPPESERLDEVAREQTITWATIDEVDRQTRLEKPNKAVILSLLEALKTSWQRCVNLSAYMVAAGATAGAALVVEGYFARYPEKLDALINAIEKWIPLL